MSDVPQPPGSGRPKADPEDLTLRPRPRPVTRLNRRVLIGLAALGGLLVFGAMMVALDPPSFRSGGEGRELYNVERKPTAEQLEALPRNYAEMPPRLGPPLPGDLGPGILETERNLGLADTPPADALTGFRPDPLEDALRAERLRLERQRQQARESDVFFQISARPGGEAVGSGNLDLFAGGPEGGAGAGSLTQIQRSDIDLQGDQGLQRQKEDFVARLPDSEIYSRHQLETPASPYQVMAGTVIAASLLTGINSDLPGQAIAQVTENVYDTVSGRYLLIPQGTRLIGVYDSLIAFGQERALVVWRRLILPDGSSIFLDNQPATDTAGYAGLEDEVDFHTWSLVKGIALATLLGVGAELAFDEQESDLVRALRESVQDNASQAGQSIVQRYLNLQPTITVRPGWLLRVIVNKDLVLRPHRS